MDEMNGYNVAVKVLGERIAALETDVRYERALKEEAKRKAEKLEAENAELASMLEKVQHYIERMEE